MSTSRSPAFEQEKARIVADIAKSIEELLSVSNDANRGLEDEVRLTRNYTNIAQLWETFVKSTNNVTDEEGLQATGLPGTGGHVPGRR